MTPGAVIQAIIAAAAEFGPTVANTVDQVIESARARHPELRDPPPERADDAIATETERALVARFGDRGPRQ